MATMVTPTTVTADSAANGALVTAVTPRECAYCRSPIASGERWVREKIYDPFTGNGPRYQRYHADVSADEALSCWEKHEMELEVARSAARAA